MTCNIFVDLDDTLVKTVPLESAYRLFGFTDRAGIREYFSLLRQYEEGTSNELEVIANSQNIKILKSMENVTLGTVYVTKLRPHAHPFLHFLRDQFTEVNILTLGDRSFQKEVLSVHQVLHYFNEIFGRSELYSETKLSHSPCTILVDDLNIGSSGWILKMTAIGLVPEQSEYLTYQERQIVFETIAMKNFVSVKPWSGSSSDSTLLDILPRIDILKRTLEENHAWD